MRGRDIRLVCPQQRGIVISDPTSSSLRQANRLRDRAKGQDSQPFREPPQLRAHLPDRAAGLQRLDLRELRDARLEGAREAREHGRAVLRGGAGPRAGLEGGVRVLDGLVHVGGGGGFDAAGRVSGDCLDGTKGELARRTCKGLVLSRG